MIINNEVSIFDEKKFNTTVQTAEVRKKENGK